MADLDGIWFISISIIKKLEKNQIVIDRASVSLRISLGEFLSFHPISNDFLHFSNPLFMFADASVIFPMILFHFQTPIICFIFMTKKLFFNIPWLKITWLNNILIRLTEIPVLSMRELIENLLLHLKVLIKYHFFTVTWDAG